MNRQDFSLGKHKNSGISLVEIIVVVAIISVLVGVSSIGFGMVSTKSATQCAKNIQISLERARMNTMGKKNGYVAFFTKADGVYVIEGYDYVGSPSVDTSDSAAKKIGKDNLTVNYCFGDASSVPGTVLGVDPVIIEFNRSDGSVKTSFSKFKVSVKKGSKTYNIELDQLTGRVSMSH